MSQLRKNILTGSLTTLINVGIVLITYPFYLGTLGYVDYGLWLILSTFLSLSRLSDMGVTSAVTKRVAEEESSEKARQIQQHAALLIGGVALLPCLLFLLFYH